jgi:hypothetical protein
MAPASGASLAREPRVDLGTAVRAGGVLERRSGGFVCAFGGLTEVRFGRDCDESLAGSAAARGTWMRVSGTFATTERAASGDGPGAGV